MDISRTAGRFRFMSAGTQFLTDANGAKVAAVIPMDEYEELMGDLDDLGVVAERRDEPKVSLEDVKRHLEEDGLLRR